MPVLHTAGASGFAVAASQAAVQVLLRGTRWCCAFQHLLDQVDTATRSVQLIAQRLVGRAGSGAEATVHTFAQNGFGLLPFRRITVNRRELSLHGLVSLSF